MALLIAVVFALFLYFGSVVGVYLDARDGGNSRWGWTILAIWTGPVGAVIYFTYSRAKAWVNAPPADST